MFAEMDALIYITQNLLWMFYLVINRYRLYNTVLHQINSLCTTFMISINASASDKCELHQLLTCVI